jgi:cytochrome c
MKKGGLLLTALLSASFLIASCQNKQEEATQQPATEQQEQTQEQEQATQQEQQNTQEEQMQEEQTTNEEATGGENAGENGEQAGEQQQTGEQGGEGQTGGEENKGGEQGATNEGGNANGGGENANAGGDVTKGKQLFTANGCTACHQEKADTVGPALAKIAQAYAGKKEDLIKFLKGEGKAVVDPAKFSIMQPQLNTTKALSDKDLNALAEFILSHK